MSEFFSGIYGARFPDVVFNSGPLPPSGGLPAPLHDTPDARINYNSTLLGDLTPYAYGEPGYQSSQTAFLNIPHRVQKIVPVLDLPTAKPGTTDTFALSHPVDDSDVAFVLRLDRKSLFCAGLRNVSFSRAGLSTQVDALVNLATLNYILSGIQLGVRDTSDHWYELLHNADPRRFPKERDLDSEPIDITDLLHFVRFLATPFGVVRGSEKQGGQNEVTQSPATWPVCFVVTLVIDGKEGNVVNVWHHHDVHAGDDLVLRFKPMPLREYTLNHYYKHLTRAKWDPARVEGQAVWQLVPDVFTLHSEAQDTTMMQKLPRNLRPRGESPQYAWQELGYWHIGRAQVMAGKHVHEEYYFNDMANQMKTHHLDMTFEPTWQCLGEPRTIVDRWFGDGSSGGGSEDGEDEGSRYGGSTSRSWLENVSGRPGDGDDGDGGGDGPDSARGSSGRGSARGPSSARGSAPPGGGGGDGAGGASGGGSGGARAWASSGRGAGGGRPNPRRDPTTDAGRAAEARVLKKTPTFRGITRVRSGPGFDPFARPTGAARDESPVKTTGGAGGRPGIPPSRGGPRPNANTRRLEPFPAARTTAPSSGSGTSGPVSDVVPSETFPVVAEGGAVPVIRRIVQVLQDTGRLVGMGEESMSEDGQALATETDAAPAAPLGEAAAGDKRRVSFGAPSAGVDLSDLLQPRKGKKTSRGAGSSSSVIEGSLLGVDGSETPQPMSLL